MSAQADMTSRQKLLLAAEAALDYNAYRVLRRLGLDDVSEQMRAEINLFDDVFPDERCLYLCLLAAMEDDK
jgi:hypothetical protein